MTLYNGTEFCVTTDQQRNLTIVAPDQITFHALQDSIFAPYIPISISRRSENNSYKPHRSVEKSYLAVVCGLPIAAEGTIKYSIMAVDDFAQLKIVKPAQITPYAYSNIYAGETNYEIIGSIDKLGSVLKITTRRPFFSYTDASENMMGENVIRGQAALNMEVEQIKVHLSSLKMPILGDKIYGIKSYRSLHLQGWGHYVDFTKSHGVKALPGGLPLFLHLRDLRFLGFGDKDNVTVTNPLPDIWRALFKSANILLSR
jgi:hypothetical protein